MEAFEDGVSSALRSVVASLEVPAIIVLLLLAAIVIVMLGALIAEYFVERRHFKVYLPRLVDELKAHADDPRRVIEDSGMLLRQKQRLIEVTRHPEVTPEMRESLAVGLEYEERRRYDNSVKFSDLLAKIAPMLGLLNTLIPLGPGVVALGQADTSTLSAALLTAFDATSLGLVVGALALVISYVHKRWYKDYMVAFDACMECLLETEKARAEKLAAGEGKGGAEAAAPSGEGGAR